jgi:hypothetical protein
MAVRWLERSAALLIILSNVWVAGVRLAVICPTTPWESALVVNGVRIAHGQPVYAADRAAGIYAPLTYYLGALETKLFGPTVYAPRATSLIASLLTVTLLAFVLREYTGVGLAAAVLLAVNWRAGDYFVDSRPDAVATLFGLLFLVLIYRALERCRPALHLAALACLLVAFGFKQTLAQVSVIPLLSVWFSDRDKARRELLWLLAPLITLGACAAMMRMFFPVAWHFIFEVPTWFPMVRYRLIKAPLDVLSAMPIVFLAAYCWLNEKWKEPLSIWLFTASLVLFAAGSATAAAVGGSINRFLPALYALFAFSLCRWRLIINAQPLLTATALLLSVFADPQYAVGPTTDLLGDPAHYRQVVQTAKALPGRVVCPEDPTIPLLAKGYAGRQVLVEADTVGWRERLTQGLVKELSAADYAIELGHPMAGKWITSDDFVALGFSPVADVGDYRVWRNTKRP